MKLTHILTIAGSDSSGGAGIQADIKTISALGGFAMSAITALTAQNTYEVRAIHPVPESIITDQISAVAEDLGVDAAKTGMLATAAIIHTVADSIEHHHIQPLVVDPVMVSTSGACLLAPDAIGALIARLLPLADLVTPNIPEAELLLGHRVTEATLSSSARELGQRFQVRAVLLKGGHLNTNELTNVLYNTGRDELTVIRHPRIESVNTHGTGCTLSAALATLLGLGRPLPEACHEAINYLTEALQAAREIHFGRGHGPVDHFYRQRSKKVLK